MEGWRVRFFSYWGFLILCIMTPADEIRADIETAKAEVKGIIERFTEKHGYMEITISASHNLQDIMNNKQVFRTHVSINAKL